MRLHLGGVRDCLEWIATEELPFAKALFKGVRVHWGIYVRFGHAGWCDTEQ